MTEYTCDTVICQNADLLNQQLRNSKDTIINDTKSVLGILAQATQTPAKKWVLSAEYDEGDIVSLNNIVYIANKASVNKSPVIFRDFWQVFQLPNTQNMGKIKGYIIFKTDLTIIKSYNISSINEFSNSRYTINFITPIDSIAVATAGLIESVYDKKYILDIHGNTNLKVDIQILESDLYQTTMNYIVDTNDMIVSLIFFSNGTTLH
jgi:hypothetical protein